MNIVITIVARGGSRGCPRKHVRQAAGKPLISHTVIAADRYRAVSDNNVKIVISTDSLEIKHMVTRWRVAECPGCTIVEQRPGPTDTTPKLPAIRNAVLDVGGNGNLDAVIDLDATAPLRTIDDIAGALELYLDEGKPDCVISCTRGVGRNPYWNLLEQQNGTLVRCKDAGGVTGRQQTPQAFEANSSIYVYKPEFLLNLDVDSPLDGRCVPYVMPDESFYHVDTELDFLIVKQLLERREQGV